MSNDNAGNGFHDVIVIGGGFAGLTAARDLGDEGLSVLLLEGRDRLGGRTYYRTYKGAGIKNPPKIELGGAWIVPKYQPYVANELERYDISRIASPTAQKFVWALGDEVRESFFPVPTEQVRDLELAIHKIISAAERIDFQKPLHDQGLEDLDVPFSRFFDEQADLPRHTRDLVFSWVSLMFGGHPDDLSALHALSWVTGFDNSAYNWYEAISEKWGGGTKAAIDAIAEDSGADICLSTPVARVEQDDDGVRVTTRDGQTFVGRTAVVAVPINCWSSIDFDPPLAGEKRGIAEEKHAGQSVKIWALVKGVGTFNGVGWGDEVGVKWLATEYVLPEGALMVGFGISPDEIDVLDEASVEKAIHAYLPDAEVVSIDVHDWNDDEFANGTWMAYGPSQVTEYGPGLAESEGKLFFAGSDIATGWTGWMDGAIGSGQQAAREVIEEVGGHVERGRAR